MSSQTAFESACEEAKMFQWSNDEKSALYGLYKQATVGDVTTPEPGFMDGPTARYKWAAWKQRSGMSAEDAKAQYEQIVGQKKLAAAEE